MPTLLKNILFLRRVLNVANLRGIKFYTGKLPEDELKKISGEAIVSLAIKARITKST